MVGPSWSAGPTLGPLYVKWAVSEGACPTRPGHISWLTDHVDLLPRPLSHSRLLLSLLLLLLLFRDALPFVEVGQWQLVSFGCFVQIEVDGPLSKCKCNLPAR